MTTKPLVRRTIVTVLCFDPQQEAILLVEQAKPGEEPKWALPGGTWEVNESAEEAARREVAEETGLDVRLIGLYDSRVEIVERDDLQVGVYILTYEAECAPGQLAPQDPDHHVRRAAWIPIDQLQSIPFSHPGQRKLLQRYLAERWGKGMFFHEN